jgi:hypothetical protein
LNCLLSHVGNFLRATYISPSPHFHPAPPPVVTKKFAYNSHILSTLQISGSQSEPPGRLSRQLFYSKNNLGTASADLGWLVARAVMPGLTYDLFICFSTLVNWLLHGVNILSRVHTSGGRGTLLGHAATLGVATSRCSCYAIYNLDWCMQHTATY